MPPGVDNLWYTEQGVSHIISVQALEQSRVSVLWNIYGHCVAIALPYNT